MLIVNVIVIDRPNKIKQDSCVWGCLSIKESYHPLPLSFSVFQWFSLSLSLTHLSRCSGQFKVILSALAHLYNFQIFDLLKFGSKNHRIVYQYQRRIAVGPLIFNCKMKIDFSRNCAMNRFSWIYCAKRQLVFQLPLIEYTVNSLTFICASEP